MDQAYSQLHNSTLGWLREFALWALAREIRLGTLRDGFHITLTQQLNAYLAPLPCPYSLLVEDQLLNFYGLPAWVIVLLMLHPLFKDEYSTQAGRRQWSLR